MVLTTEAELIDEFNGPKSIIDQHGNSLPTQQYVDWLEARVATLTKQLAISRSLERPEPVTRSRLYDEDYIPYPDEGDDR